MTPEPVGDGFDADTMLCPGHSWAWEDRTPQGVTRGNPWYMCQVCDHCRAIRCDATAANSEESRCVEARHHALLPHRVSNGETWPVGMNPSDSAAGGRWHL